MLSLNSTALSFEQQAYEIEGLWVPERIGTADADRIALLATKIPADVTSVLDVGCGGGIFVNFLQAGDRKYDRICGVDRSGSALKYVRVEKRQASIEGLPFGDGEFDLVACLEVIEHLPIPVYKRALGEIARVAKRHVLLSVPNEEDLDCALVTCPCCRTRYNADYHMRRFDHTNLISLLAEEDFECRSTFAISARKCLRDSPLLRLWRWRHALQGTKGGVKSPPWYAVCPMCGFRNVSGKGGTSLCVQKSPLKNLLESIWPKEVRYAWIGALYSRKAP
jgi:SAM-dependent methyltransferase